MQSPRKRPFGVTIIVLLQLLGALGLALNVAVLRIGGVSDLTRRVTGGSDFVVLSDIFILSGVVIAFGLWRLKHWAWLLIMVRLGLGMISDLLALGAASNLVYFSMLINVVTVFYLNQREVRQTFEAAPPEVSHETV